MGFSHPVTHILLSIITLSSQSVNRPASKSEKRIHIKHLKPANSRQNHPKKRAEKGVADHTKNWGVRAPSHSNIRSPASVRSNISTRTTSTNNPSANSARSA